MIACVGGGSNAMGIFHPYIPHEDVRLIGVEAAGEGIATGRHAASLTAGRPGVLHGNRTYLLQDENGQIIETHSISAGLDYPGVGPEHAWLKDSGRAEYVSITDDEALAAFHALCRIEGIIPALEIGARARVRGEARGDAAAGPHPARQPLRPRRQGHEHRRRALGPQVLLPARMRPGARGTRERQSHRRHLRGAARRRPHGADPVRHRRRPGPALRPCRSCTRWSPPAPTSIELGVPFSDPMADGPVIQRASERALAQGTGLRRRARDGRASSARPTR